MLTATPRTRRVSAAKHAAEAAQQRAFEQQVNARTCDALLVYHIRDLQHRAAFSLQLVADRPALSLSRVSTEAVAEACFEAAANLRGILERFAPAVIAGKAV